MSAAPLDENRLIWIDLEMTGLDPDTDSVIEIATLVTDKDLNVLAEGHDGVSRAFGARGPDKFAGVDWALSPAGVPILSAALTWAECRVEAVHPGGDHEIVVGRVLTLGECRGDGPLLFFKGRYHSASPVPAGTEPEVVDTLLAWPRHTDWI